MSEAARSSGFAGGAVAAANSIDAFPEELQKTTSEVAFKVPTFPPAMTTFVEMQKFIFDRMVAQGKCKKVTESANTMSEAARSSGFAGGAVAAANSIDAFLEELQKTTSEAAVKVPTFPPAMTTFVEMQKFAFDRMVAQGKRKKVTMSESANTMSEAARASGFAVGPVAAANSIDAFLEELQKTTSEAAVKVPTFPPAMTTLVELKKIAFDRMVAQGKRKKVTMSESANTMSEAARASGFARGPVAAANSIDAFPEELQETTSEVAVEVPKFSPDNKKFDESRKVVIDRMFSQGKRKKVVMSASANTMSEAAKLQLQRDGI